MNNEEVEYDDGPPACQCMHQVMIGVHPKPLKLEKKISAKCSVFLIKFKNSLNSVICSSLFLFFEIILICCHPRFYRAIRDDDHYL